MTSVMCRSCTKQVVDIVVDHGGVPPSVSHSAHELPIRLEGIRAGLINDLRRMNQILFPIKYSEKVYCDIVACGSVSQLAYDMNGNLAGGIGCRLENTPKGPLLYIISLGVLAPYRGMGVASRLLAKTLEVTTTCLPEVSRSQLHVQVGNEEALRLYQRAGFKIGQTIPRYYPRLNPPDAVLLTKSLNGHCDCVSPNT